MMGFMGDLLKGQTNNTNTLGFGGFSMDKWEWTGSKINIKQTMSAKELSREMKENGLWHKVKYSSGKIVIYGTVELPNGVSLTLEDGQVLETDAEGVAESDQSAIFNGSNSDGRVYVVN